MIEIDIPGAGRLSLDRLVCDYNGTLALDGKLIDGVAQRLKALSTKLEIHVLTADTFGLAAAQLEGLPVTLRVLAPKETKADYLRSLRASNERTATVGNGFNDATMLDRRRVGLALAVLGPEGLSPQALKEASVLVRDVRDGLDLLLEPRRLVATLRA